MQDRVRAAPVIQDDSPSSNSQCSECGRGNRGMTRSDNRRSHGGFQMGPDRYSVDVLSCGYRFRDHPTATTCNTCGGADWVHQKCLQRSHFSYFFESCTQYTQAEKYWVQPTGYTKGACSAATSLTFLNLVPSVPSKI
jgi:hypothetical protein